jgi:hypothetical protein
MARARSKEERTQQIGKSALHLLAAIDTIFEMEPESGANPVEVLRLRYSVSLCQFAKFLESAGLGNNVPRHFLGLAAALHDLTRGTIHPVLRHTPGRGKREDRADVWAARHTAALGLDLLIQAGAKSAHDAAIEAAKKYSGLKRLLRRGRVDELSSSLLSWRTGMIDGTAKLSSATKGVRNSFAALTEHDEKRQVGCELLRVAEAMARQILPSDKI